MAKTKLGEVMSVRIIKTHTDLSYGNCKAQEGKNPTGCLLKESGFCKMHKGESNRLDCVCPLDDEGLGVIIFKKVEK